MTERKYADENLESVIKFFRSDSHRPPSMTNKSVVFNRGSYSEIRYDFFFDKLKRHSFDQNYRNSRISWAPEELKLGWKVADKNMTTRYNYKWQVESWHVPKPSLESLIKGMTTEGECPDMAGDGLCIARQWTDAFSGGAYKQSDTKLLFLAYIPDHVLCDNGGGKLRVRSCYLIHAASLGDYVTWVSKNFKFNETQKDREAIFSRITGELNYQKALKETLAV